MQGLCKRGPCPRADHRRGLNLGGRTVSAATTVADPIGDLAALHEHFVRGRVVGLGFCHSDLLLTPANSLRSLSPMPAFQFKTHQPQGGCLSFSHRLTFLSLPGGHFNKGKFMYASDMLAKNPKAFQAQELPKPHYVVKTTVFTTCFRNCQMARFTGLELSHNPSQKQCPE